MDEKNLDTAFLEQLIQYMPKQEQMEEIASLKDQYQDLNMLDQFIVEVAFMLCCL